MIQVLLLLSESSPPKVWKGIFQKFHTGSSDQHFLIKSEYDLKVHVHQTISSPFPTPSVLQVQGARIKLPANEWTIYLFYSLWSNITLTQRLLPFQRIKTVTIYKCSLEKKEYLKIKFYSVRWEISFLSFLKANKHNQE